MTHDDPAQEIEAFVRDIGRVNDDDATFGRTVDLFDNGYVDSLGIVALTAFIEQHYGVTLTDADLFDPRVNTIDGIVDLIASRAGALARTAIAPEDRP